MLRAHKQAWAWQDEWHGLTLEDIRRLEQEVSFFLIYFQVLVKLLHRPVISTTHSSTLLACSPADLNLNRRDKSQSPAVSTSQNTSSSSYVSLKYWRINSFWVHFLHISLVSKSIVRIVHYYQSDRYFRIFSTTNLTLPAILKELLCDRSFISNQIWGLLFLSCFKFAFYCCSRHPTHSHMICSHNFCHFNSYLDFLVAWLPNCFLRVMFRTVNKIVAV